MVREQLVRGLEAGIKGDLEMCKGCKMGRSSEPKHPRKSQEHRAKVPLELVHTDIAGPFNPKAIGGGGSQYNLVIVDDFSRKSRTISLRNKSDTKVALKEWITVNENQVGKKVKKLRLDNGGEYIDAGLEQWLKELGSPSDCPRSRLFRAVLHLRGSRRNQPSDRPCSPSQPPRAVSIAAVIYGTQRV